MKEEKILLVGGVALVLKKSNFEEFRRTNLVRNNKYLIYYDGSDYWKISKEIGLPAIRKQIEKFIIEDRIFKEDNFERGISFLPILFYNSLIEFKEIPVKIGIWFKALKSFLKNGKAVDLPSYFLEHSYINQGTQKVAVLRGSGLSFLYDWLNRVFSGRIKVKVCEADFCNRIFIPSRFTQKKCCEAHRQKTFYERTKKLKKKKKIIKKI